VLALSGRAKQQRKDVIALWLDSTLACQEMRTQQQQLRMKTAFVTHAGALRICHKQSAARES
jgi:hypothetical protein